MASTEHGSLIAPVLARYYPLWAAPSYGHGWRSCHCPAHDDERASCAVNYDIGAVKCQGCDFKGDVISIIRRQEGCGYREAVSKAKAIAAASGTEIPRVAKRKPRRRILS